MISGAAGLLESGRFELAEIEFGGERLVLSAARAAWIPARRMLLVADAHFGKAHAFRRAGVPVPAGSTRAMLDRLSSLVKSSGATRVVFLGDFLHAPASRASPAVDAFADWRSAHSLLDLILVRGNHDLRAGDPPDRLGMDVVDEPWPCGPLLRLAHHPAESAAGDSALLAGHLHPGIALRDGAQTSLRLPCFHFGSRVGVLPAFGGFTGLHMIRPAPDDRIWCIAEDKLIRLRGH